jgi:HTH-type transcriptional regulator, competence development regulator
MISIRMEFGQILRDLRLKAGLGIKRLAPELDVSYSYLSKLENNEIAPSADLVNRVARYFDYSNDSLMLSAGKVPREILEILRENPDDAVTFLRERFGGKHAIRSRS